MKLTETELAGVYIVEPAVFGDHRGFFMESWSQRTFAAAGLRYEFVQDNHSSSAVKGTLRGIHFQRGEKAQAKLVRCTRGAVLDVAVVASWPPSPRFFGVGVVPAELTGIGQEMTFYFLNRLYLYLLAYLIIGWDILWKAVRNIGHGQVFDENFLMCVDGNSEAE